MHRVPKPSIPDNIPLHLLPDKFSNFFHEKICKIRDTFSDAEMTCEVPFQCTSSLSRFELATPDEVVKIISSSSKAYCDLDPIPTFLVKDCKDILAQPITNIINKSLSEGIFPHQLKMAHVTPLLKKSSLSKNDLKNYRPVSNLSYLSKILEKVVARRLNTYLERSSLTNKYQSAYKRFHSTESALLKVQNDILMNMDRGEVTALTLLDLSAAFDTIDHKLLFSRLHSWFGVTGLALNWFSSYLTDRAQQVKLCNLLSSPATLKFGVPQGSVLGPILFTLYTSPLSKIIDSHKISHHLYADDTQLYVSFSTKNVSKSINTLKQCVSNVSD